MVAGQSSAGLVCLSVALAVMEADPTQMMGLSEMWSLHATMPVFSAAVAAETLAAVALAGGGLWLISERAAAAREVGDFQVLGEVVRLAAIA